jgi:hypothetical protein
VDAAADEEDSDLEEHSLGDSEYSSVFFLGGGAEMDNYETQRETFSSNSGPRNSAMNVNEILSVFY